MQSQQQPILDKYAGMQMDTYGKLAPGAEAGINSAQGLVNDTLAGKYLAAGNPFMDSVLSRTNRDIADTVNGQFEQGGRYGAGMHAGVLADRIADNENSVRMANYTQERQNQVNAVGQASGLMGGSQSLLNSAADLPWIGVSALNGNVRQASNGYSNTTTTTSDPLGSITGLIGAGASLTGAIKSDERIKNVGRQVGTTPDGLPIFDYTYKGDPTQTPQTGVMAQDVAQVRPDALGPTAPDGTMSVDYGKLGLPDPTTMAEAKGGTLGTMRAPTTIAPITAADYGAPAMPQVDYGPSSMVAGNPGAMAETPKLTDKIYGNKDNVDRSFGAIIGRFASPDPTDKWGKLGLIGQHLMAADGSPFQSLGKGLLQDRKDEQTNATAETERLYKQAQIALENRKANQPTWQNVSGVGLVGIPANGGQPTVAVPEGEKRSPIPFGFKVDDKTGLPVALPGFLTPADKEAEAARRDDQRQSASDKRQAQMFAHSDAMQARSLAAIAARQGANATSAPLPTGTVDYLAQRYMVDGTLPQLGMGKASAGMKAAILNRAVELSAADGLNGRDGVAAKAGYAGQVAGQRALGTRSAQINLAAEEASQTFPLARQASAAISRTGFMPFTQVQQAIQAGNNNPQLAAFNAANQAVITTYSRAVSPTGQPTVSGTEHARALISTAMNKQAYDAVLNQMEKEIAVAKNSVSHTRASMTADMTGHPAFQPKSQAGWSVVKVR